MGGVRAARVASWIVVSLTVGVMAGASLLDALSRSTEPAWLSFVFPLAVVMSTSVGLVVATRRRYNPIGWLLLANGLVLALNGLAANYAAYGLLERPGSLPGTEWAVLFDQSGWPTVFAAFTAIAFVFPDGRLPSPRWRPIAWAAIASFALFLLLSFLRPGSFDKPFGAVSKPLPQLPEAIFIAPFTIGALGMLASLFAAALAVGTRLRRASGVERSQIKLLAYASALIPAAVVAGWAEGLLGSGSDTATVIGLVLVVLAIPLAIGVAVMRYRLYEVDRLINRTLVYLALSALLALTYAAVSLTLGVALGAGSTLPTAAATLAVALAFGALRSRVQMLVDRRFSRARYEGLRRVERYLVELRAGRAAPEATGPVLAEALGDPSLELFFWLPESDEHVDFAGRPAPVAPDSRRDLTPVRRGSLLLGAVLHDRALSERPDLLESVIDAAGLAIEIGRLRAEVARRLAEVEQSRARIVTAGYEERRRLERDLHDGAQQRLVSIGLALRHIQNQVPASSREAGELDDTVVELGEAIKELRELARGVRPARLDDGLGAALRELASRSAPRTTVDVTEERFQDHLETAAYFVASEALANAAKHAQASQVTVTATSQNGSLLVCVRDDGVGGACPADGSGLGGMTDRVAALGGSLSVDSPPGQGTVVTVELPCES
ncbi:MAG: sensor histidine kinase [Actinobacteria bacterium]|nr:sensor histidine kinase [Actinomycetota bacterium]